MNDKYKAKLEEVLKQKQKLADEIIDTDDESVRNANWQELSKLSNRVSAIYEASNAADALESLAQGPAQVASGR